VRGFGKRVDSRLFLRAFASISGEGAVE